MRHFPNEPLATHVSVREDLQHRSFEREAAIDGCYEP